MRLEDLSSNNVKSINDLELRNFRERANQLFKSTAVWTQQIHKRMVGVNHPIERDKLLEIHYLIQQEIKDRGMPVKPNDLDKKVFKRNMRGIDTNEMPAILVKDSVVSLSGDFVTGPRNSKTVTVRVDADEFGDDGFTFDLEKRMASLLTDHTGKSVVVRHDGEDLEAPVIPVYDLVLIPRENTVDVTDVKGLKKRLNSHLSKEQICTNISDDDLQMIYTSKALRNELVSLQMELSNFDDVLRKDNHFEQGIHVVWGMKKGKTKVQSIRFDTDKFTLKIAEKWLKEHDYKTDIKVPMEQVEKQDVSFLKSEEKRIVGGVVYGIGSLDDVDAQGDFVDDPNEIYKAMKSWMISGHDMHFMHEGISVYTPLVECFQAEVDTIKGGSSIPAGSWYISNYIPVECEGLWKAVKDGSISGYSMSGKSKADIFEEV